AAAISPEYMISADVALPLRKNECCSRQPASNTQRQRAADGPLISAAGFCRASLAFGSASDALRRRRGGKIGKRDALIDGKADRGDHSEQDRDDRRACRAGALTVHAAVKEMERCARVHPRPPRNDSLTLFDGPGFFPVSASGMRGIRVSATRDTPIPPQASLEFCIEMAAIRVGNGWRSASLPDRTWAIG